MGPPKKFLTPILHGYGDHHLSDVTTLLHESHRGFDIFGVETCDGRDWVDVTLLIEVDDLL